MSYICESEEMKNFSIKHFSSINFTFLAQFCLVLSTANLAFPRKMTQLDHDKSFIQTGYRVNDVFRERTLNQLSISVWPLAC